MYNYYNILKNYNIRTCNHIIGPQKLYKTLHIMTDAHIALPKRKIYVLS